MPGLTEGGTAVSGELLHRLHLLLYYNWKPLAKLCSVCRSPARPIYLTTMTVHGA